jgi:hypothetical protein
VNTLSTDLFDAKGRPIIVLDNPSGTELYDASGRPYRVVDGGVYAIESAVIIPAAEARTIASGVITPTLPGGLYASVSISGEGGAADDLTLITAPVAWIGKLLLLKMAGAGVITVVTGVNLIIGASNFTLDDVSDRILLECVAVNTWVQHYRSDNVHH